MADKEGSKPVDPIEPLIVMFFVAAILGLILMRIEEFLARHTGLSGFFNSLWLFVRGQMSFDQFLASTGSETLVSGVFLLRVASLVFSVLMVWAILIALRKYADAYKQLTLPLKPPKEISYDIAAPQVIINPRWQKVLEHVNSTNASEWRLAILEADIMLGDMLDKVGYVGSTIGDKLKSIEPGTFVHLNEAWEAHKVRNAIAHEGSNITINKPEAERVVKMFEKVFKEFHYI